MNRDFLELMMEKTGFPQEAKTELLRCADSLAASGQEAALDGAVGEIEYAAAVTVHALLPEGNAAAFAARMTELSAGTFAAAELGERFQPVPLA